MPLTKASTVSPRVSPRSDTIGETSHSAISSTGASFSRRRPGSPWMPMPTSTSSSGGSKVGVPAAGTTHDIEREAHGAALRVDPGRRRGSVAERRAPPRPGRRRSSRAARSRQHRADRHAQRVLDRDVVVGDDRRDLDLAHHELRPRAGSSGSRRRCRFSTMWSRCRRRRRGFRPPSGRAPARWSTLPAAAAVGACRPTKPPSTFVTRAAAEIRPRPCPSRPPGSRRCRS